VVGAQIWLRALSVTFARCGRRRQVIVETSPSFEPVLFIWLLLVFRFFYGALKKKKKKKKMMVCWLFLLIELGGRRKPSSLAVVVVSGPARPLTISLYRRGAIGKRFNSVCVS